MYLYSVNHLKIFNYLMPCSTFLFGQLTVILVKKFSSFCRTWRHTTMFKRVSHWSPSWARWTSHPISVRFINIILPSMPTSPKCCLSYQTSVLSVLSHTTYMPRSSHLSFSINKSFISFPKNLNFATLQKALLASVGAGGGGEWSWLVVQKHPA